MNYQKSKIILKEIQKARKILLNCHRGPDPDSIGSALAMFDFLKNQKKEVEILCPSDELYERINFLQNYGEIQKGVNFSEFDFSKYNILITIDSSNWDQVVEKNEIIPDIKTIVIDHHASNTYYGTINLVDKNAISTSEIIYGLFEDWKVKISRDVANCLLTGIIGDTGVFRYPNSTQKIFKISADLMEKGADKNNIIHHIYRSEPFSLIKFYAEVLNRLEFDRNNKFVWSAIPYEVYKSLAAPLIANESASSMFAQVVEGTNFGLVMTEQKKNLLKVSFRSRTGVNCSKMAVKLGGGGHIFASGARVEGLPFKEAVEKVLRVARDFAREHK